MVHTLIQVTLVLTFIAFSLAAVAVGPSLIHPDHPGECWVPELNKTFPDNARWQLPGQCRRYSCFIYKTSLYVEEATCGAMAMDDGCFPVQNLSLPYPSCCPYPECIIPGAYLYDTQYDEFNNWINENYPMSTS